MACHDVDTSPRTLVEVHVSEDFSAFSDTSSEHASSRSPGSEPELGVQDPPLGFEETNTEGQQNAVDMMEEKEQQDIKKNMDSVAEEALRAQALLLAIRTSQAFHARRRNVTDAAGPDLGAFPVLLGCRKGLP
eukprot:TRINITY_DN75132_c0_g1_i1.p1 TRINITY_DN75132_c0_g1~~TRINITY_DN75132_c0_g1_i1.p1  ORF type:complete len:133 (-),score=14.99 TRINITY_DN75132_c0_g1_i1:355-753(-)